MYDYNYSMGISEVESAGVFAGLMAFLSTYIIVILAIAVISIIANWKIFTKAGRPGWASIVPFYSQYVMFEIVGMKGWYIFLGFIPFVGSLILAVMSIIAYVKLANCFGKSTGFAIGLIFLSVVFLPILAFGNATYTKPAVAE